MKLNDLKNKNKGGQPETEGETGVVVFVPVESV